MTTITYPKRLIEVDLPIKRISAHARREKSIRHGHISTLHIWWARRPLAACRAVICASLWPDPADPLCPQSFREVAAQQIQGFVEKVMNDKSLAESCDPLSFGRWNALSRPEGRLDISQTTHLTVLRDALLDFIADFSNWDNSTNSAYLETSRALTQSAHEALGGAPGTRPLVVDPFAGGGAIPLEALRVGADAFASDLNPVAVLLNKVVLEYIPMYGQQLADEVRKWGEWIKQEAEKDLAQFYPKDSDGETPIAYLWARTIHCEGPGCGTEVPLIRSLWLAKNGNSPVALQLIPNKRKKCVDIIIIEKQGAKWFTREEPQTEIKHPQFAGTVKRGSTTCPVCGYTTQVASVRRQLKERLGGAIDARLFCVVSTKATEQGRFFRMPTHRDVAPVKIATAELERRKSSFYQAFSLVPDETLPLMSGVFNAPIYGHTTWGSLFTSRQSLTLTTLVQLVRKVGEILSVRIEPGLAIAVQTCLAMALDRQADHSNSLCSWNASGPKLQHLFGRQAIPMFWDFAEAQPFGDSVGDWLHAIENVLIAMDNASHFSSMGHVERASATHHPLPDNMANAFITDPPYYNAVPYADLSDFFYVWLRRAIGDKYPDLFLTSLTPKEEEICEMAGWDPIRYFNKNGNWFEQKMKEAMSEGYRILSPSGVGIVIFAHKSTSGWEAQLQAMINAGWIITGSWPIDTEMATRLRGMGSAVLASSIHLVCRPRVKVESTRVANEYGDWRDVLAELPKRIHDWMPRLAQEGVVGADAIFACLGPALEIYSRYARVEKASGEQVTLKEYLEYVWAAVAREALTMIFTGADTTGFEEDSRLTAMWLWTLTTIDEGGKVKAVGGMMNDEEEPVEEGEEEPNAGGKAKPSGYFLEYDAARKIAQGLGAHLEHLTSLVEVKGNKARLLPVAERAEHLFGKDEGKAPAKPKKKVKQRSFFEIADAGDGGEDGWGEMSAQKQGMTVLDRVHQSMLLFAAGRGDALKRYLVDENVGNDQRFWRLAQAFSALYPASSDEKRWVDGVLARKKGLGF